MLSKLVVRRALALVGIVCVPLWAFQASGADVRVSPGQILSEEPKLHPVDENPVQLFVIGGPSREVDLALTSLPAQTTLGRTYLPLSNWSIGLVFTRTEKPSTLVQGFKAASPQIHVEVLRDLRVNRRSTSLQDGFKPEDFLYSDSLNLLTDLKRIANLQRWKVSSTMTPLEQEALLLKLSQYLTIFDEIVKTASTGVEVELGPQKSVNRKGYRYTPDHELVKNFILPARALARDIFRVVLKTNTRESRDFFYLNVRKADLAGFFALNGEMLDELLDYDLKARLEGIDFLGHGEVTRETVLLPNIGRKVTLVARREDDKLNRQIPNPIYALGFEHAMTYQMRVETFLEEALRASVRYEMSQNTELPQASALLDSFLRALADPNHFILYQSSQSGDITSFELRRYQQVKNAIFNSVLAKVTPLRHRLGGSYLVVLEHTLTAIRKTEEFFAGRDLYGFPEAYHQELMALKKKADLLLNQVQCESAMSEDNY